MTPRRLPKRILALVAASAMALAAHAATTDLSSLPLITSSPAEVKPNLMFILDDSGSMAWSHMPDTAEDFAAVLTNCTRTGCTAGTHKYGYRSSQCNGVYYNPNIVYRPPIKVEANGQITSYPDQSFTSAMRNGFDTSASPTRDNLSTSFRAWRTSDTNTNFGDAPAEAAHYYVYTGTQTSEAQKDYQNTNSTFYRECASKIGDTNSPGYGVFTRVNVSSTSGPGGTDERTNFANWYSYYRTRMLMMKSATGHAFQNIGERYRVGYMSINNNVGPSFLNISDFTAAQKNAWYTKLYSARPASGTPLRESLSTAGRIFANKVSTKYGVAVTDPVQYSCQKNFTILSTDGYWNGAEGKQLDGSTSIGNQDVYGPRPYSDGGVIADVYRASITVSANNRNDNISSIKVNGVEILSATATAGTSNYSNTLATNVTQNINNCTSSRRGNCGIAGFSAIRSGSTVTITAPASVGPISVSPVVTANSVTVQITAFSGSTVTTGGAANTLADVAYYYYHTDLRSSALGNELGANGTSVAENNVLPGGDDDANWQHMTTFTLGLGARGRMVYSPTYKSDNTGDFAAIRDGLAASSTVCTWQSSGTVCNWPVPGADQPENIDDLWHAAVNGRGTYFSATDPASLSVGLTSALQGINAITSDSAAATTSNPNVTQGDNFIFSSTFRSASWHGDLERRQIDTETGEPADSPDWTAGALLDANASRTIYTFSSTSANKLKAFTWDNLTNDEKAYFTTTYLSETATPPLSQFCSSGEVCLDSAAQAAAGGAPLVDFLRGARTNEGPANDKTKYFRLREHVLGDIVNSEAVYVKLPQFDYADAGYAAFKTSAAIVNRPAMVYVGANDGMLHAFNANTGAEMWAYVPKLLLPTLYRLADKFYATNHQYYVDGSPQVGDVKFADGSWHTILVGGLNAGGRGYYALDITDPTNPKALWEFTDDNMGYTFGRPEITKLANGKWVVLVTSGYNNVNPGDGQGYLYVLDAETGGAALTNPSTGQPQVAIGTGAGSAEAAITGVCDAAPCPSGLAQIRAWVESTRYDNTAVKVYGGDLFGNVWRFDINDTFGATGYEAQLLATLRGPTGAAQSVTARPELGKVAGYSVVYVGTGRYLGASDLTNSEVQSIYAIKDDGGSSSSGNPRANTGPTGFVQQSLTDATCAAGQTYCPAGMAIRTGTSNVVNFATQKGWFIDLPGTRERATTDPQLALGTLTFTTNILNPSACTVGGTSFVNFLDYRTGAPVSTATNGMVSLKLGDALATRPVQLKFNDGTVRSLVRMSDNTWRTPPTPIPPNPAGTRRVSWRELAAQ